jgi:hypothetical protein
MGRAPWRPADLADAITGRSTKVVMPKALLKSQLPSPEDGLALDLKGQHVELLIVQPNPEVWQVFIWPYDDGERVH